MARHSGSAGSALHAESAGLRFGRRIALSVLVGSVTAFALCLGSSSAGLVRDLVLFNLAHLAAACLCSWPRVETPRARRAWRLVAIAILLSTSGNVCFTVIPDATLTSASSSPMVSDVLYLAAYPFMGIAVVQLVRERRRHITPTVWLDGLVVGLGAAAVVAALVPAHLLRAEPPLSGQALTDLAYPMADLTLLIVLGTVVSISRFRLDPRLALLGVGLGLTLLTDLAYLVLNLTRSYHEGNPVDLGWLVALLPIATAACLRGPARQPDTTLQTGPIERTAIAAPTAAGIAALAVLVGAVLMGQYRVPIPLASGALAAACILVALLRTALTLRQLQALPEARREARTDPLTDLANRRHLQEWCARLLARPDAAPVTLLMIDLNGFKIVNDRHGHPVGDALLVEVANRFATTMRHDDLLARLGGDEFAAVLPRTTPPQARAVAQRMHATLATPIEVAGHTFRVDASVGISAAGRPGINTAMLFQEADTAMYRAKKTRAGTAIAGPDQLPAKRNTHRDDLARRRA
jgi:diguanylate cyclase (GGDEF)-like protein